MEQKAFPAEDETEDELNWWGALTAVAMLVVPLLVFAAREGVSGWMLAFVYFLGLPAWLVYYGFACWMAPGFWVRGSKFARAALSMRLSVVGLVWGCLAAMAFFGAFMSDGGDEDFWRSPVEKRLGFTGEASATPQWLQWADHLSYFALLLAGVLFCAAAGLYLGAIETATRKKDPVE